MKSLLVKSITSFDTITHESQYFWNMNIEFYNLLPITIYLFLIISVKNLWSFEVMFTWEETFLAAETFEAIC